MDASRNYEERGAARMTVEEAARSLGIKEESVRKRVRRKKMRSEKDEGGRLYVYVDATKTIRGERRGLHAGRSADESRDYARELIESKDETIRILQVQLQEEREARRRADASIAQLTQANAVLAQRVTELEATQGTVGGGRGTAGRYGRALRLCAAPGYRRVPGARVADPPVVEESFRGLGCRSTVRRA